MKNRFFNKDDWGTPKYFYDELNKEFNFDFDPCPLRFVNDGFDGLKIEWGKSNFINPPYDRKLKPLFVEKAINESLKGKVCVMLLPVSTSTKLFHEKIKPFAKEIRFLKGRVPFIGINSKGEYVNWHFENLSGLKPPQNVKHVKANGQQDLMLVIFDGTK
jgi:site-specific DNA-methyltransferase (adenine-specific)